MTLYYYGYYYNDYYGDYYNQCNIVTWALGLYKCYMNCYDCWDEGNNLSGIQSILAWESISSSVQGSYLSNTAVQNEIYAGRPFIIQWKKPHPQYGVAWHFIVAFGYDGDIDLYDPKYGYSAQYWDWVKGDPDLDDPEHYWDGTLTINYSAPDYVNIGHDNGSGVNNEVEFFGCYNNQEMRGLAICRGDWVVNPCAWTSSCSTGWEYDPDDYYYTGEDCSFCE